MRHSRPQNALEEMADAVVSTREALRSENTVLRLRLTQLEQAFRAIRDCEVDALFVPGSSGGRVFALEGTDRAYRALIEEMGEGALTLTPEGIVLYANRHFAALLGRPLERVMGVRIGVFFAPECYASLLALLLDGQSAKASAELDLVTEAGPRVATLVTVNHLTIDGFPDTIGMVVTDLTWQKRSEAATQARQTLLQVIESQRRSEERLRVSLETLHLRDNALGAISQGVLISDARGHTTYVNHAFEVITGYSAAEAVGQTAAMLQGPGTAPAVRQALREAVAAARPFHSDILNYRKDGTPFLNALSVTPVFDAHGSPTQSVGVMRDVTASRNIDAQLRLAAQVFKQSGEGVLITDSLHRIVKVNQAFTTITGFSEADALGQNTRMLSSSRHDAGFFRAMWNEIHVHGHWQGEIWNRRKDGSAYLQWLSISRIADAAGDAEHFIASFSDITQRKDAEDRIWRLAHYDVLTGLPNRALLRDRAAQVLQMAHRKNESMALLFIDLDHFKNINDSLGHAIGDQLLVEAAGRMKAALRDQDTLSRTGGDEFVLLLPGADAVGAAHVAQKLLQVAQLHFQIGPHELTVTPSIGIALYPANGHDFDLLSKCADAAMYRAKQNGRNTFCFFTAEIQAQSVRALLLENALRRALERGQMHLVYQPQRDLQSGRIVGAEALLRWQHPELGAVSPAEFIPVAESSGLISSIGEWVLRTAVRQLKTWHDAGMAPMTVAVNLSAVQFRQRNLSELVESILEEAGVAPQSLELELTESVASDDPVSAITAMNSLDACGVRMSIDDFGTGYSSLSYLKRFKVYKLKIDQSFVHSVLSNPEDKAIVTAIIAMAHSLGLLTIAEGVETEAQMNYLRDLGCDEMQGYWFSRPLAADRFKGFVDENTFDEVR